MKHVHEYELRDLIRDQDEIMGHIFFRCVPQEQLGLIQLGIPEGTDWVNESCKVPVSLTIGNISVNPKNFFDMWVEEMQTLIEKEARKLIANAGSARLTAIQEQIANLSEIVSEMEEEIQLPEPTNPLIKND